MSQTLGINNWYADIRDSNRRPLFKLHIVNTYKIATLAKVNVLVNLIIFKLIFVVALFKGIQIVIFFDRPENTIHHHTRGICGNTARVKQGIILPIQMIHIRLHIRLHFKNNLFFFFFLFCLG